MLLPDAVDVLSALAHVHRLAVFRLLVKAGPNGSPAGQLARDVRVLPNTLSTHLNILTQAGLVTSRRAGRSVIYCANFDAMRDLLGFLVADCCGGRPEICAPLAEVAQGCRPAA